MLSVKACSLILLPDIPSVQHSVDVVLIIVKYGSKMAAFALSMCRFCM